jgi:hypothetical protein
VHKGAKQFKMGIQEKIKERIAEQENRKKRKIEKEHK